MRGKDIKEKIHSFPRWHYRFDLRGYKTPIFDRHYVHRHNHRKELFFDPLVDLFGGTLEGRRVLDLGCNAGWWSLHAIEAGCDYVLGVDGRRMHTEQADFVFEVNGIEEHRYDFVEANVFDVNFGSLGDFDLVLCLGLLYHVGKPLELVERIAGVNTDVLVLDTTLSKAKGSFFEVWHDRIDEPRDAVDYEFVLVPTRQAVVDLAREFGYLVAVPEPDFRNPKGLPDYRRAQDYKKGTRRAFICAKKTDLSRLDVAVEPL